MNQTMKKFGYPETLIREYSYWSVQLRPKQATLGSLVAVCNEPVRSFGQLSEEAFTELKQVTAEIEAALGSCFGYAKINYLMLMMTDPDVHFHVLPRYPEAQNSTISASQIQAGPAHRKLASTLPSMQKLRSRL